MKLLYSKIITPITDLSGYEVIKKEQLKMKMPYTMNSIKMFFISIFLYMRVHTLPYGYQNLISL